MLIRLGYDIGFNIPAPVTIVAMLHVHPSREPDLLEPDELKLDPEVPITSYIDTFGNRCSRFVAPSGHIRLTGSTLIRRLGLGRSRTAGCDGASGCGFAQRNADLSAQQPLLRGGSALQHRRGVVWRCGARLGPGAGHLQLGLFQGGFWLSACPIHQDRSGCVYRAGGRMPRLSAPGGDLLPGAQHTGALCDRIPGRYWDTPDLHADGLQRLV